jgi:hypothetical protein
LQCAIGEEKAKLRVEEEWLAVMLLGFHKEPAFRKIFKKWPTQQGDLMLRFEG